VGGQTLATIFVAGVYGVGKSTLCEQLSNMLSIPAFSSGDLISSVNGEQYGANKVVSDKNKNQDILVVEVNKKLRMYHDIILAGHFCILNINGAVDYIAKSVYKNLCVDGIILLEAPTDQILTNLAARDHKNYNYRQISKLQDAERIMAQKVTNIIESKLYIHNMHFNATDSEKCGCFIKGVVEHACFT
jgi:Archaeal adenylate kinase